MSQHGPHPGKPWPDGSDEPYTEPADPWRDAAASPEGAWGGHPPSLPPMSDSSGPYAPPPYRADPAPGWDPPAPRPRRNAPMVALVVVLTLLVCGGLVVSGVLISRATRNAAAGEAPASTPTAGATTSEVAAPEPRSSSDARFVEEGQCVRNEGTADEPEMTIVGCASGTYEVLRRVDGKTTGEADAEAKCRGVDGYTKWYFYDSELDELDFVLCLRDR
ncbi:LppU/SCO3897 family protein [Mangrovihabitans endophyticus]|uniref:Uncharacterized protein n=1 Tax=Mangrovihabitans endophyticus TaxID=1751298 RepID=A0A8J3C0M6_9ACTN|nr:hypothetical protein [Mangrovihabitans endophyticus]GGK93636.1 hypothetical protein GCM10012284_29470 [Mangrovihabitans endophyticus]